MKHDEVKRNQFEALYRSGGKWTDISRELNVPQSTLIRWLSEMNLPRRSKLAEEAVAAKKRAFYQIYKWCDYGVVRMAKLFEIDVQTAKYWRRQMGFVVRKSVVAKTGAIQNPWREYWIECEREIRAMKSIEACWSRHPLIKKKRTLEEQREYGRLAARRRWERLGKTPEWKIRQASRNAVSRIVRMVGGRRNPKTRTFEYLGCDYDFARAYIEARFLPGMTWENHGDLWHIDHIIPLAAFDLMNESERKKAMHFTNLQPLWADDNRRKSARLPQQMALAV
jgi:hypothetical protein